MFSEPAACLDASQNGADPHDRSVGDAANWTDVPSAASTGAGWIFIARCREDLAGRGAEAVGFSYLREGPADLGELVGPPPALLVGLRAGLQPRPCKMGLAYRPFV